MLWMSSFHTSLQYGLTITIGASFDFHLSWVLIFLNENNLIAFLFNCSKFSICNHYLSKYLNIIYIFNCKTSNVVGMLFYSAIEIGDSIFSTKNGIFVSCYVRLTVIKHHESLKCFFFFSVLNKIGTCVCN